MTFRDAGYLNPSSVHRSRHLQQLGALMVFVALSLALTYPLVLHLRSAVLGAPGDNLDFVWKLWWFKHATLDLHQTPFFCPDALYPTGFYVGATESSPLYAFFGMPVTALLGEVAAYNLWILLSFVLTGYATFLLVRHYTGNGFAGMLAGVVITFSCCHQVHAMGHLHVASIQWIPLTLLEVERALTRVRIRHALWAGLWYALLALSGWYYAYYFGLLLLLFVWLRARGERRRILCRRGFLFTAAFGVVAGALIVPFLIPLMTAPARADHGFSALLIYSASITDFFVGNPLHPVWGPWVRSIMRPEQNLAERVVFLGFLPMALAVVALARRRHPVTRAYAVLAVVSIILALGPVLQVFGRPVAVSPHLPPALEHGWQTAISRLGVLTGHQVPEQIRDLREVPIPLPALPLALALPFFTATRAIARFGVIAMFAVAVLSGIGFSVIAARASRRVAACLAGLAVAIVVGEFLVGAMPLTPVRPSPENEWLARQPGQFTVAWLPPDQNWGGPALYGMVTHQKRIVGAAGPIIPPDLSQFFDRLRSFPDPASISALRERGVKFVVVNPGDYGAGWKPVEARIRLDPRLRPVYTGQSSGIYELR